MPVVVAPVRPGSGGTAVPGRSRPGAAAISHSATRVTSQAEARHAKAISPGVSGTRRRRSRAARSSTQATNGATRIAIDASASQPRITLPESSSTGEPSRSIVGALSSSATRLATAVPSRPSWLVSRFASGPVAAWPGSALIARAEMPWARSVPCSPGA
jgi:hypothetical protein